MAWKWHLEFGFYGDVNGNKPHAGIRPTACLLLSILNIGAYGSSMASNYNTRNRAAEVLVNGAEAKLIRRRETIEQQLANEQACF